jgi:hypothetical protein
MRFLRADDRTVHPSYVASAPPAADVEGICDRLDTHAGAVRGRLDAGSIGITLVLPQTAAEQLDMSPDCLRLLRAALQRNGLEVNWLHHTSPMLPPELRPAGEDWIAQGLAKEPAWARQRLVELGLRDITP